MKSIVIEISSAGDVKVEAVGFKGKGCEKATAAIEEALGKVSIKKHKPEYRQTEGTIGSQAKAGQ